MDTKRVRWECTFYVPNTIIWMLGSMWRVDHTLSRLVYSASIASLVASVGDGAQD